ncbi:Hsp70 family protein [Anaerobaca lacustris]|uniref:Hsp70 family protein n=1 Tax=Anaerobaca lacustris TaxID=3044600 RepID=A0AAW6TXS4_9BACT|nr:Hsp70 family protein [Sedimentisphaerales bacterium M17dextr]
MIPAIDAGTGRFKMAVPDALGNPKLVLTDAGQPFLDSVVYFEGPGAIIIGSEARNAALVHPDRAVFNWKRHMGTDEVLYTDENGKAYCARDILAILLERAKEIIESKTGEPVNDVVVSTPANYDDRQRQETLDAGAEAGLHVLLTPKEPTCAALGNEIHKRKECTAVVFDLGAGTFDISVVRATGNLFEVITTGGEAKLGGADFSERARSKILDEFERQFHHRPTPQDEPLFFQSLWQQIEQLKISLSIQKHCQLAVACNSDLLRMAVQRDQFESWIDDLVGRAIDRTQKTLQEARLQWSDIDEVYAVGGGSMVPLVKQRLEEVSGKKVSQRCEAHCAHALGGVIAGRLECHRLGKPYRVQDVTLPSPDFYLREILSHPIGVAALDGNEAEICCEMLAKNTPIPSQHIRTFKVAEPGQTAVRIRVLDGPDGAAAGACLELGHFELTDLPARPDLVGRIEIVFHIDANALLTASARDTVSGKTGELQIDYRRGDDHDNTNI